MWRNVGMLVQAAILLWIGGCSLADFYDYFRAQKPPEQVQKAGQYLLSSPWPPEQLFPFFDDLMVNCLEKSGVYKVKSFQLNASAPGSFSLFRNPGRGQEPLPDDQLAVISMSAADSGSSSSIIAHWAEGLSVSRRHLLEELLDHWAMGERKCG